MKAIIRPIELVRKLGNLPSYKKSGQIITIAQLFKFKEHKISEIFLVFDGRVRALGPLLKTAGEVHTHHAHRSNTRLFPLFPAG